jgi:hypothetical protein
MLSIFERKKKQYTLINYMIHDERVPHRNHPAPLNPVPAAEWKFGCCASCTMDLAFAAEAFFCQPCATATIAQNLERMGQPGMNSLYCYGLCFTQCCFCPFYPCVLGLAAYHLNSQAADRWKIKAAKDGCCNSFCFPFCCPLCLLCILKSESYERGEFNGSWCSQQSPNYTIEQWSNSYGAPPPQVQFMGGNNNNNNASPIMMMPMSHQPYSSPHQHQHQPIGSPYYPQQHPQQPVYYQQQSFQQSSNMATGVPP